MSQMGPIGSDRMMFSIVETENVSNGNKEVYTVPNSWVKGNALTYKRTKSRKVWQDLITKMVPPNTGGTTDWVTMFCKLKERNIMSYAAAEERVNYWLQRCVTESSGESDFSTHELMPPKRTKTVNRKLAYQYDDLSSDLNMMTTPSAASPMKLLASANSSSQLQSHSQSPVPALLEMTPTIAPITYVHTPVAQTPVSKQPSIEELREQLLRMEEEEQEKEKAAAAAIEE